MSASRVLSYEEADEQLIQAARELGHDAATPTEVRVAALRYAAAILRQWQEPAAEGLERSAAGLEEEAPTSNSP